MSARLPLLVVAVGLLAVGATMGTWRVAILERFELEHEGERQTLRSAAQGDGATPQSARVAEVRLRGGEQAIFELCAEDRLEGVQWRSMELAVWEPSAQQLLARTTLDEATLAEARRAADEPEACLTIARGRVPADGRYAVEAVWADRLPAAIADVPLQVRVLARVPIGPLDRVPVALSLVGALALIAALSFGARGEAPQARATTFTPGRRSDALVRLAMGLALVLAAAGAVANVPVKGASASFVGGLFFAIVQVLAAFAFVARSAGEEPGRRQGAAATLGLRRPNPSWWRLVPAVGGVAAALVLVAMAAVALVPSTGEAPIQTFVSWPSGLLSFALLALLVPIAEEIFFRGFVYSTALALGRVVAFALAAGLFVAAHAPQVWGGWGGLVAVTVTGIALTGLRAWTGSILPGAAAHLAYNALLAASEVF